MAAALGAGHAHGVEYPPVPPPRGHLVREELRHEGRGRVCDHFEEEKDDKEPLGH